MNNNSDKHETKNEVELKLVNGIEPNEIITTLTNLCLSKCNLKILPEYVYQMKQLRHLDLSYNLLQEIPLCLDTGLELLETLDLSYNRIVQFENEPKCFKRLRTLLLNNNCLSNIPEWVLHVRCLNLQVLNYTLNLVTNLTQSRFHCYYSYNLKELYLQNCCLKDVHLFCIKSIYSLEKLDLSNVIMKNNINVFFKIADLFNNPAWSFSLKVLILCDLKIDVLPDQVGLLKSLCELNLSHNDVDTLPDSFGNLIHLEYLNVSYNHLYHLPISLKGLKNLKHLILHNNSIGTFPDCSCLNELRLLDLYNNELKCFDGDYKQLQYIDLDLNYIKEIDMVDYIDKKLAFRKFCNIENRNDNQKSWDSWEKEYESEQSSTLSDCADPLQYSFMHTPCDKQYGTDEEPWDVGCDKSSSSLVPDNNWTGVEYRKPSDSSGKRIQTENTNNFHLFSDATI